MFFCAATNLLILEWHWLRRIAHRKWMASSLLLLNSSWPFCIDNIVVGVSNLFTSILWQPEAETNFLVQICLVVGNLSWFLIFVCQNGLVFLAYPLHCEVNGWIMPCWNTCYYASVLICYGVLRICNTW